VPAIYTIGHSSHSIADFVTLLARHGIGTVADVRSQPYSRFNPQFRRDALRRSLAAAGIDYVFLGEGLGARSADPSCCVNGKVSYELLARTPRFRADLAQAAQLAKRSRTALLCAERDPLTCHRTILVARELERLGIRAAHILADGTLESRAAANARLLAEEQIGGADLFRDQEQLEAEAYRRRAERIAYAPKGR
jgi:uncharacterized protein (DUF488 family)